MTSDPADLTIWFSAANRVRSLFQLSRISGSFPAINLRFTCSYLSGSLEGAAPDNETKTEEISPSFFALACEASSLLVEFLIAGLVSMVAQLVLPLGRMGMIIVLVILVARTVVLAGATSDCDVRLNGKSGESTNGSSFTCIETRISYSAIQSSAYL